MPLLTTAEIDAALQATGGGETVTRAGVTAFCIISGADDEELVDASTGRRLGTPISVIAERYNVTIRTGAFAGLAAGDTVTIRGAGHTVDRVFRQRDEGITTFMAYQSATT